MVLLFTQTFTCEGDNSSIVCMVLLFTQFTRGQSESVWFLFTQTFTCEGDNSSNLYGPFVHSDIYL